MTFLKTGDAWAIHNGVVLGWAWKQDTKNCRRKRRLWCRFFHAYKTHTKDDRRKWCKCCAVWSPRARNKP